MVYDNARETAIFLVVASLAMLFVSFLVSIRLRAGGCETGRVVRVLARLWAHGIFGGGILAFVSQRPETVLKYGGLGLAALVWVAGLRYLHCVISQASRVVDNEKD